MPEDPHQLEEGWVVVFRNGLRLKVKTEASSVAESVKPVLQLEAVRGKVFGEAFGAWFGVAKKERLD